MNYLQLKLQPNKSFHKIIVMKRRRSIFFIGLISAIITLVSLNFAFGRSGYYSERYPYYSRYHNCDGRYDWRYDDKRQRDHQRKDSISNY